MAKLMAGHCAGERLKRIRTVCQPDGGSGPASLQHWPGFPGTPTHPFHADIPHQLGRAASTALVYAQLKVPANQKGVREGHSIVGRLRSPYRVLCVVFMPTFSAVHTAWRNVDKHHSAGHPPQPVVPAQARIHLLPTSS